MMVTDVTDLLPSSIFIPFMVGAISLVAFLSIRNVHLAKGVRDICGCIRTHNDSNGWQNQWTFELSLFVTRYMWSNLALILSIFSVFIFGLMIGVYAIIFYARNVDLWSTVLVVILVAGGLFGSFATLVSVKETLYARNSLSSHVAFTLLNTSFSSHTAELYRVMCRIERCTRRSLDQEVHRQLRSKMDSLRDSAPSPLSAS